jgi:hypothetical protein
MGKHTIRVADETPFSIAVDALTYQSPVTRDAIRK